MSIANLTLRCAEPAALRRFYRDVFDARDFDDGCALGAERIVFARAVEPRLDLFLSNETGFQHFALVVADMRAAHARLCGSADWRPISTAGPQRLPSSSGAATAFKFRDPEGHPLELLQFADGAVPEIWRARFAADPQRVFFGIDHTGVTVSDPEASEAFWSAFGLVATHRQTNRGPEQARLDGFSDAASADVEIVSLSPRTGARPGVELLAYRSPAARPRAAADGSTAATEIVLSGAGASRLLRDPDGHRLRAP